MGLVNESHLHLLSQNNTVRHELSKKSNDSIQLARMKRQADRSDLLSDAEYEHFAYCQRASFNGYMNTNSVNGVNTSVTSSQNYQQFPLKNTRMEQAGGASKRIKLDRFKNWIVEDTRNTQFELEDYAIDCLICLSNELAYLLVHKAIKMRFPYLIPSNDQFDFQGSLRPEQTNLLPSDVESAYTEVADRNIRQKTRLIKHAKLSPVDRNQSVFITAAF